MEITFRSSKAEYAVKIKTYLMEKHKTGKDLEDFPCFFKFLTDFSENHSPVFRLRTPKSLKHLFNQLSVKISHFHPNRPNLLRNQAGLCLTWNGVNLDKVEFPGFVL